MFFFPFFKKIALCAHNIWLTYSGPHHRACRNSESQQGTQRVCRQQRSPDTGPGSGSRSQLHHMGCHRVTAGRTRGSVWDKKWKVSREEGTAWRPLHRLLLEFTLVSPHQRDRQGLICGFACRSRGSFFPPRWGRVWCLLDPRRTVFRERFLQFALTLFRLWLFFFARDYL